MYSFRRQLTRYILLFILLISIVHSFRINNLENENNEQTINAAARQHVLEQILTRRSFYDPAFSDSWSNYFDRKRSLFDPAYNDWANTFKRSEE
jgi:hypothetical protein